jgi:hypothetical protein
MAGGEVCPVKPTEHSRLAGYSLLYARIPWSDQRDDQNETADERITANSTARALRPSFFGWRYLNIPGFRQYGDFGVQGHLT